MSDLIRFSERQRRVAGTRSAARPSAQGRRPVGDRAGGKDAVGGVEVPGGGLDACRSTEARNQRDREFRNEAIPIDSPEAWGDITDGA